MKETKPVNHSGHRERLFNLISKAGIENVSNIQAVEAFLTFIIPRCDVNPLAHALLDRFGNFHNIIDADKNDLMKVKGINEKSAIKIRLFTQFMELYSCSKLNEDKTTLESSGEFLDFLEELLRFKTTENLYIFAINNNLELISSRKLDLNNVRRVGITPEELFNFVSSFHPAYVAVAHNHPGGSARPSNDDEAAAEYMKNLLSMIDCNFYDSFIVGEDGIYSENQKSFVRYFEKIDRIVNFLASNSGISEVSQANKNKKSDNKKQN